MAATGCILLTKNTFVNETSELAHFFVDGEEIVCTPGYKFYAPEKCWTSAIMLRDRAREQGADELLPEWIYDNVDSKGND